MIATLIAVPILGLLLIFQSAILSHVNLLHGSADLVLLAISAWAMQKRVRTAWQWSIIGGLMSSITSALPLGVIMSSYLATTGIAIALRQRIWKAPIFTMFLLVFFGTMLLLILSLVALRFNDVPLPIIESINVVILPSLLLNLILAIPAYALIGDLAHWLYPEELEL
jgi:cell shape-determining protein MreD